MKPEDIHEKIFLINDPELPDAERVELKIHLGSCPQCQESLKRWTGLSNRLPHLERPLPSPFLETQIMARVRSLEEDKPSSSSLLLLPLFRKFAFWAPALALLIAYFSLPTGTDESVSTGSLLVADAGGYSNSVDEELSVLDDDETLNLNLEEL